MHRAGAKHTRIACAKQNRPRIPAFPASQDPLDKVGQIQQLLLGVVATRLRTKYGSVDDARIAWLLDSQLLLRRMENHSIESALLSPATAFLASVEMRSVACEAHLLLELIVECM